MNQIEFNEWILFVPLQSTVIHSIGSRFLSAFFNFLIVLLVARIMGAEGKGQTTFIITAFSFILFFANLATGPSLIYLVPRNDTRSLFAFGMFWTIIIHLFAFVLLWFFPALLPAWRYQILIISFLSSLCNINQMMLYARQDFLSGNVFGFLQVLIQLICLLLFFYLLKWIGVRAFCMSYFVSLGATFLISLFFVIPLLGSGNTQSDKISYKELLLHGAKYQVVELLQFLNMRFGFFVLNNIQGSSALGIYSVGVSILEFVWLISRSLALIQYARISNTTNTKVHMRYTLSFLKSGSVMALVTLLLILIIPARVYEFVFGPSFLYIKYYMKYLMPGILAYSGYIILSAYFSGIGQLRSNIIALSVGFVFTVLLNYALVPRFSVGGSCVAATVSYACSSCILFYIFYRKNTFALSQLLPAKADYDFLKTEMLKYIKNLI